MFHDTTVRTNLVAAAVARPHPLCCEWAEPETVCQNSCREGLFMVSGQLLLLLLHSLLNSVQLAVSWAIKTVLVCCLCFVSRELC